jgi:oxygen-independent coproporphyrinogen-3 oxidase
MDISILKVSLLYIHIPFCDSKCFYCSFNSYTNLSHLKQQYFKAIYVQLAFELSKIKNQTFKSIFFGGGTPSCIEAKIYEPIFKLLQPYIDNNTEITIEANPNSATKQWQKDMYDFGVNRISFGVQSFDDEKLNFLGRNHNSSQAIKAINEAYKIGFKDINCDIIYDTIKDTKQLIDDELNIIKTLPITHISAYSLTIEKGTKFYFQDISNLQTKDIDIIKYFFNQLKKMGFYQYEISNFAKNKTSKSKHNLGYWQKKDYIGIGSGAVGTINDKRYYPTKNIQNYINNPTKYEEIEKLSKDDIKFEKIFLGLRSEIGVDINILNNSQKNKLKILQQENKITIVDKRFYNNDFLITDEIVLYLE